MSRASNLTGRVGRSLRAGARCQAAVAAAALLFLAACRDTGSSVLQPGALAVFLAGSSGVVQVFSATTGMPMRPVMDPTPDPVPDDFGHQIVGDPGSSSIFVAEVGERVVHVCELPGGTCGGRIQDPAEPAGGFPGDMDVIAGTSTILISAPERPEVYLCDAQDATCQGYVGFANVEITKIADAVDTGSGSFMFSALVKGDLTITAGTFVCSTSVATCAMGIADPTPAGDTTPDFGQDLYVTRVFGGAPVFVAASEPGEHAIHLFESTEPYGFVRTLIDPSSDGTQDFKPIASVGNGDLVTSEESGGPNGGGTVSLWDTQSGTILWTRSNPDPASDDRFGASGHCHGKVLVGAPGDDEVGEDMGAVYVIHPLTGVVERKLLPPLPRP